VKPYVICHMVTTIDGRIMGDRWGRVAGGDGSAKIFETTHDTFGVNAWLVGTTTMREFAGRPIKITPTKAKVPREDFIATQNPKGGYAIGADRKGVLPWNVSHLPDGEHAVSLLTERASNGYLAHLRAVGVSYLMCGKDDIDLRVALDKLGRYFKLKKLMLEGGGTMNGAFLRDGLIDEISHITVPIADGGREVQTIFDIPGDAPPRAAAHLRLASLKKLSGGVLWARYKVTSRPR
jgi:2,5-diamino-6-(ribosylamino)-4(3H)-pyrimidinone 5'-phosphate reductase